MTNFINGRQYEWADLSLSIDGRFITGFRGISYSESQDKELIYGAGNRPASIQTGNISFEGSITLLNSELQSLLKAAKQLTGRASLLSISVNATVCYGNPAKGDTLTTDRLFNIQFTKTEIAYAQGDKYKEFTLPFICTDIQFQS